MNRDWRYVYGWVIKVWNAGYSNVVGRFTGVVSLVLLFATLLTTKGFNVGFTEMIFAGIGLVVAVFILGFIYLRLGLIKAELNVSFHESPQFSRMDERIARIEVMLKELKEGK